MLDQLCPQGLQYQSNLTPWGQFLGLLRTHCTHARTHAYMHAHMHTHTHMHHTTHTQTLTHKYFLNRRNPDTTLLKIHITQNHKYFLEKSLQGFKTKHHCVFLALEKCIHTNTYKDMLKAFSKASLFCFDMYRAWVSSYFKNKRFQGQSQRSRMKWHISMK